MNKAEKATMQAHLNAEQKALQDLEKAYKQAKKDCQERIKALNARTDMQNLQTIVHQRKYQQVLLKQIDGVLNDLQTHTYKSANDFFQSAYENGYIGSMYEFIYQDIPLTIPISRKKMMTAIQTDSKISKDYYMKQGLTVQNIRTLKQQIAQEATRGIASGKSWLEVANSLSIQRYFSISLSDAMRICRTEGNRINQQARLDAGDEAIKAGCDLLKQWDATMDDRTRPWHREADGQIVEWDESFTVMGEKLKAPSIGGSAKNVINCRCQLLKRPRWALDEEELERLKKRAEYFGLDKSQSFEEYKQKFLTLPKNAGSKIPTPKLPDLDNLQDPILKSYVERLKQRGVIYNEVKMHQVKLTEDEIIKALAGGDQTQGSCASVGLCYVGQKGGVDVLDFRDGASREFFATTMNLKSLSHLPNVKIFEYNKYSSSVANGFQLLQMCEKGKEYYFVNGFHASIVRRVGDGKEDFEYLELQSPSQNGWLPMHKEETRRWGTGLNITTVRDTLQWRFGKSTSDDFLKRTFMFDVDNLKDSDELKKLLGYINTATNDQKKGSSGQIR